jgi:transcriptional regulator with XRE-family HTH domain
MQTQTLNTAAMDRLESSTFAERLQEARLQRGWTRQELAAHAGYTSAETIRRYERELVEHPREAVIIHLARILGVNPAWLVTGRGSQLPPRSGTRPR